MGNCNPVISLFHCHVTVYKHYQQKLEVANKLFWQLQLCKKNLEAKQQELLK